MLKDSRFPSLLRFALLCMLNLPTYVRTCEGNLLSIGICVRSFVRSFLLGKTVILECLAFAVYIYTTIVNICIMFMFTIYYPYGLQIFSNLFFPLCIIV